jgi:DMSO/TMAO reductase YedYZ molybdopterin-dependent catalytic subunit/mono/diheme cytochrome c family protein
VTTVRIAHPIGGRPSPDQFGKVFHVASPIQDQVGVITPSSLHYIATTRGSYMPDIDPKTYTLMIHGLVDQPLTFTMDDLKRFPAVSRLHFVECAGNRHNGRQKTVQESHGMTSCSEWTGVMLSTLLKECGLKSSATWFVAEGAEEVKGANSMPIAKVMDDCMIAYGQNGEALRPQQGFPVRLIPPGFEGIFHTKYLRRIKVVDRYYMNYNEFGHLDKEAEEAALGYQIGPKSVITSPSGGQQLLGRGFVEIRGLAWSGGGAIRTVEVSTDGGKKWNVAQFAGTPQRMSHVRFTLIGMETKPRFFRAPPTRSDRCNRRESRSPSTGTCHLSGTTGCPAWITASCPGRSPRTGASPMGSRKLAIALLGSALLLGSVSLLGSPALAQSSPAQSSPKFGVGRAPSAAEIRAVDISISPTGDELPAGHGTSKEGAEVYEQAGCISCHGETGIDGPAPQLRSKKADNLPIWERERILPLRAPFATVVWDFINRGMPLGAEGSLSANEVYAVTAYLLFLNKVIPEDQVLDRESLPKVKMPIGDEYARLPEWKHGTPRLKGYPY